MDKPLVSVIIPTRNRQIYAEKTVKQILELKQNIEIIVHDNSDDDSLFSTLKQYVDNGQVKYAYEKKVLPFSENYNRAAEMATGLYLCAIGDDDGILPNISKCAEWMMSNEIDIVKPAKDQVYFYPGNINRKKNACVGFGIYSGGYFYSNPETSVIALLDDGGCNYLEKNLAGSYHGLVNMKSMQKVKELTGKYYAGLTPDMYSVICLSLLPNIKFAVVDYPITLPGVCPASGSAASDSNKHVGRLEDAPHLKALPQYNWSEYVPRYYSVETIWAETMIYAIQKMGRMELVDKYYNKNKLAAYIYMNNRLNRNDILKVLPKDVSEYVVDSCRELKGNRLSGLCKVLANATTKISGRRRVIRNVPEICKAAAILSDELQQMKISAPW